MEWSLTLAAQGQLATDSLSQTVHPVPAPFSVRELATRRIRLGTRSQKEMLLSRGNAINYIKHISFKDTSLFYNKV